MTARRSFILKPVTGCRNLKIRFNNLTRKVVNVLNQDFVCTIMTMIIADIASKDNHDPKDGPKDNFGKDVGKDVGKKSFVLWRDGVITGPV